MHSTPCHPEDFLHLKFDGDNSFELIDGQFDNKPMMPGTHGRLMSYLQHSHRNETKLEASKVGYMSTNSAFRVGKLENGSYTSTEYSPGEKCNFPFIREMSVCENFDPPSTSKIIQENVLLNHRRLDKLKMKQSG